MRISKFVLVFLIPIIEGCSHYYYVPNTENVPLFREKKEARINGGYGFGDYSHNIEIQAAYALGQHVGLTSSFQRAWGGDYPEESYGRGIYLETGPGYYTGIGDHGVFETYGGLGHGSEHHGYISAWDGHDWGRSYLELTKLYLQPAFGIRYDFMEFALSTRLSFVDFDVRGNNVDPTTGFYTDLNNISTGTFTWIEPAFTARLCMKKVGIQFQILYSKNLNSPEFYIGEEVHCNIGIYLKFGPVKTQNK